MRLAWRIGRVVTVVVALALAVLSIELWRMTLAHGPEWLPPAVLFSTCTAVCGVIWYTVTQVIKEER